MDSMLASPKYMAGLRPTGYLSASRTPWLGLYEWDFVLFYNLQSNTQRIGSEKRVDRQCELRHKFEYEHLSFTFNTKSKSQNKLFISVRLSQKTEGQYIQCFRISSCFAVIQEMIRTREATSYTVHGIHINACNV